MSDRPTLVHPLAGTAALVRGILDDGSACADLLVAVADARGRLLALEGPPAALDRARGLGLVAGASWAEDDRGPNALGRALTADRPAQLGGVSAAPVHDPLSGRPLGAIAVVDAPGAADPQTLTFVRACRLLVESELRRRRTTGSARAAAS